MFVELKKPSRLNGMAIPVGEKIEVDDTIGASWIQKGRAKKVNGEGKGPGRPSKQTKREKPIETAVKKPEEKAVQRGGADKE